MNPPKSRQNSITRYSIREENLVGCVNEPVENYDLMTAVMICLGKPEGKHYEGILKLLDVLLSSENTQDEKRQILQNDFDIPMSQTIERQVGLMCNLSKGIDDKAVERTLLESISNLMDTMKLTAEQAMAALKVPESERPKYSDLLK